ncbi:helix-turn-helix transcriptional regulator [Acinetobacter towneri]|uniref:helix-turn-helix domain-containing protein n=1 Tax=Acinetobacter TaxID=469 RepID=UPI0013B089AA|nr:MULTISPECIES: helix-turn-helix transcriptional regulator [Acinetobacter]MDM1737548.1 helix-turn-helix transcriptional regulator [Acinetobacter towneri]QIC62826.1 helix-turn-helix transcriptional regulator [Acinetobacter schindleri]
MMENKVNTSIDAVIGLILSNIRKNKKISQESAAKYIGVTKQAISNMENGRSKFSVAQVYQLCSFYSVEPGKVFEALDEAIESKDVTVYGTNNRTISKYTTDLILSEIDNTSNVLTPITGVTLAGYLGMKFMKKITNISSVED